jgi:RNA polymerase sigma-70 factor (family 1)
VKGLLTTYEDAELVELVRNESAEAFEEIYNRYWQRLYSSAYKRVGSRVTAEEIVQDIFASFWANRKTLLIQSLQGYLQAALKYKVINHYQKEAVRKRHAQQPAPHSSANATENAVFWNDLQRALVREVSNLPDKCQAVFRLSREENLTMKEVAMRLGISEKTVENHLSKALRILKVNLRHFLILAVLFICR